MLYIKGIDEKKKVCGFLVLVIEEIVSWKRGKSVMLARGVEGNEMRNACFSFYHC